MACINWGSIMKKAEAYMETPKAKQQVQKIIDEVAFGVRAAGKGNYSVEDAGFKFADVLLRTVESSGLDPAVIEAISHIYVGTPFKLHDGTYMIIVTMDPQMRETMSTKKEYYSVDLVELYNDGVDHVMPQIWERDERGSLRTSRQVIIGAHFMEQAVIDFMGNYASDYNVISIDINKNY